MKISACWITKNEAANIKQSIESLINVADELVVLDTGSTDDTVKVAESLGARVAHFEWIKDFAAARNHAITLATGDIIIFLDADEWFDPALTAADREILVDIFTKNPKLDCLSVVLRNIDLQPGISKVTTSIVNRIFQNKERIRYKGRVHEHLDTPGGIKGALIDDRFGINHTGYSKSLLAGKLDRNIALLEAGYRDSAEGSQNWVRFQMYLIREYHHGGQVKRASEHLVNILKYPSVIKKLLAFHNDEFMSNMYVAMTVAFKERSAVSRRDVYNKLFVPFKQAYPNYPGTIALDLLYQAFFDMKEDRFLKEFEPTMKAASRLINDNSITYYRDYERFLYERASLAAWRRGERVSAMEHAVSSLKSGGKHGGMLLAILLTVIKGQPWEDIVLFLNSIYDVGDQADLEFLINATRLDGFKDVHTYYVKKRMDSGVVRAEDYLCLMLIHQKYGETVSSAAESRAAGNKNAARYLFLAAICGNMPEAAQAHAGMLEEYAHILNAYFNGERLKKLTDSDLRILQEAYALAAFASGFETADRLRAVFAAKPAVCFKIKANYCETSNRFDLLQNEDTAKIAKSDHSCRRFLIQALIYAGHYPEALQEAAGILEAEAVEQIILQMLLVIAEKAPGDIGAQARALYERYIVLHDAIVDLGDVVRTGIVFDDEKTMQQQSLKKMTRPMLDKVLKEETEILATSTFLELSRKAAEVYRQNRRLPEAARCLCRLIAHKRAQTADYEALAEIFSGVKNTELPGYIRELAV